MHLNAGVNLTTNSVFSTSDPRSAVCACPVAHYCKDSVAFLPRGFYNPLLTHSNIKQSHTPVTISEHCATCNVIDCNIQVEKGKRYVKNKTKQKRSKKSNKEKVKKHSKQQKSNLIRNFVSPYAPQRFQET